MYDHTLHHRRKHFCCYCLQAFSTEKIFKSHTNECFRIIDKQTIKIAGKGELLDSKIIKGKKITIYDLCRF